MKAARDRELVVAFGVGALLGWYLGRVSGCGASGAGAAASSADLLNLPLPSPSAISTTPAFAPIVAKTPSYSIPPGSLTLDIVGG